jgi:hypothetical protein
MRLINLIRSNYRFLTNEDLFMTSASYQLPLRQQLSNFTSAVRNALKGNDVAY